MLFTDFKDCHLSQLGFGAMRLPLLDDGKTIDSAMVARMTDQAIRQGVNYFDTAYPYHGGLSEVVMGKVLRRYPRESWYLADKYPGHQTADSYNPAEVFEDQLRKCGVDYFDFYLLHNVSEYAIDVYLDPQWKIVEYFAEQRRKGRIRHLGFSSHANLPCLKRFLDSPQGREMEFCQIQLNYMDWTLQKAREKCELLAAYDLPIWVMEPVRGGRLAHLSPEQEARLHALRPDESTAAWAFRWLQDIPNVKVILSGMSAEDQMEDNLQTFASPRPLSPYEKQELQAIADSMHDLIPCTGCRYCCDECPQGLDIPTLIGACNDLRLEVSLTPGMTVEAMPADKQPSACLACGACAAMCPQQIDIPSILQELTTRLEKVPKWAEICKARNEEAKALRMKNNE